MAGKWMVVVVTVWIQAFTGTNFDFAAYSSELKAAMGISQLQLNYLATASDLGKALGWSSGVALLYLPLPAVLLIAAAIGIVAYGGQWLLVTRRISLSYFPVFVLCLLAGCSISWFNTVCFVLCVRNFAVDRRPLALSLTISFNGLSASLYAFAASAISTSTASNAASYLLLNATLPLLVSTAALLPILRRPQADPLLHSPSHDSRTFALLHVLAFFTGLYLLFLNSSSSSTPATDRLLLAGALLLLPICVPGAIFFRDWVRRNVYSASLFRFVSSVLDLQKRLVGRNELDDSYSRGDSIIGDDSDLDGGGGGDAGAEQYRCYCGGMMKDRLAALGEEHSARRLVRRVDFWLYYVAYFCCATVGLVYSNNVGQIAQSLAKDSQTSTLIAVYSSCSFFGRLLSSAPDFLRERVCSARTGWLAVAVVPLPVAFFLLAESGDMDALLAGTALIGLSSGFIFSTAVSVTSELFGADGLGVNHNILITNIPLGSLLYGLLAALIYDANGEAIASPAVLLRDGAVVCMGRKCYAKTFLWWAGISLVGFASSLTLYFRTRAIYRRAARRRAQTPPAGERAIDSDIGGAPRQIVSMNL